MAEIVADCPRCRAHHVTFDVRGCQHVMSDYGWKWTWEAFCVCRRCGKSSTRHLIQRDHGDSDMLHKPLSLVMVNGSLESLVHVGRVLSLKDESATPPPDHLPPEIDAAFREGATCVAVGCFNASATMFRLCIDLATRSFLPDPAAANSPNAKVRRDLGLRLPWLFDNGFIPEGLRELSTCVKEDGNDGAHAGTLTQADADDLLDFATALLERLFTEPARLRLAKERRDARRAPPGQTA